MVFAYVLDRVASDTPTVCQIDRRSAPFPIHIHVSTYTLTFSHLHRLLSLVEATHGRHSALAADQLYVIAANLLAQVISFRAHAYIRIYTCVCTWVLCRCPILNHPSRKHPHPHTSTQNRNHNRRGRAPRRSGWRSGATGFLGRRSCTPPTSSSRCVWCSIRVSVSVDRPTRRRIRQPTNYIPRNQTPTHFHTPKNTNTNRSSPA